MNKLSLLLKHKENIFWGIALFISLNQIFDLFSYGYSIYKDSYAFSNYLNYVFKIFQNVVFFFLFLQFFVKYNIKQILLIIPLAIMEQQSNLFVRYVHPFFLNTKFYDFFSSSPQNISPEYPRIIVFSIFLFTFLVLIFNKKFRNLPRIFLLLGSLSIFLTSVLFHHITVSSINIYKEQQKNSLFKVAQYVETEEQLEFFCKTNSIKCIYSRADKESQTTFLDSDLIPKYLKNYIEPSKKDLIEHNLIFDFLTATDFTQENRILAQKPVAFIKNKNFFIIAIDEIKYKQLLIEQQYLFVKLGFSSHIVWFFGPLFLIWFHTTRRKNKPHI